MPEYSIFKVTKPGVKGDAWSSSASIYGIPMVAVENGVEEAGDEIELVVDSKAESAFHHILNGIFYSVEKSLSKGKDSLIGLEPIENNGNIIKIKEFDRLCLPCKLGHYH